MDTAPEAVHRMLPNARLITLLRNPVDRAYSQYNMQVRDGVPSFEEAIDPNHPNCQEAKRHYLERGDYARFIERWLQYFPREQMLFLQFERFFADPHTGLDEVHDFLGLERSYPEDLQARVVGSYSKLNPETREKLEDHFADANARLAGLLGEDFIWPRGAEPLRPAAKG